MSNKMPTTKNNTTGKTEEKYANHKKLSKAGEWMRAHPKGFIDILDWRAVMK
jgi:hypothetical protein